MIIDCISDLHGFFPELEGGDLLIIAGDMTARDSESCWIKFFRWLNTIIPIYKKIIIIGGNHDNRLQNGKTRIGNPLVTYLCDSWTEFKGLKIWGSPWTKTFEGINPHCCAFTLETEGELENKWDKIPWDTHIIITHSPPYGILDRNIDGKDCGSISLATKIFQLKPKLHVFGHLHESYGENGLSMLETDLESYRKFFPTISINASHVNEYYRPINKPIRVIL